MLRRLASVARTSQTCRIVYARGIATTSPQWAASNFVMPALSPTMTEGNIASWKVKEGDSFAPGDVLLEIETDKATMDVEAQDEGVVAKITQKDGSKAVKVGQRIAVLAETGDDLSSLEIPAEEEAKPSQKESEDKQASQDKSKQQDQQQDTSSAPAQEPKGEKKQAAKPSGEAKPQSYPLYPSVQVLLHQRGLSTEDANKIPASGPNGRLLKGDVLAYLGEIEANYSAEQSKRLADRGHLDLSNIKIAPPHKSEKPVEEQAQPAKEPETNTEIAVPVSLGAVYELQTRIEKTLGVSLPLSTIIARASDIANELLPAAKRSPTSDELFDAVLGLDKVKRSTRGNYIPQITALEPEPLERRLTKALDIIDVLAGPSKRSNLARLPTRGRADAASVDDDSVFSITAQKGEEQRVRIYLERVKTILESEPSRCIF